MKRVRRGIVLLAAALSLMIQPAAALRYSQPDPEVRLDAAAMTLSQTTWQYDGTKKTPDVTVAWNGTVLIEGEDYTVSYLNNVNQGIATVTAHGIGAYTGSVSAQFQIVDTEEAPSAPASSSAPSASSAASGEETPAPSGSYVGSIGDARITLDRTAFLYDGMKKTPGVTVVWNGLTLTEGQDYTLFYLNNVNQGVATVLVRGIGGFTGASAVHFEISG